MPWHRADQEQHGDHDEYAYPRLPFSHGLTSVLTLPFPGDAPPDVYCTHERQDFQAALTNNEEDQRCCGEG
jgi:hypothetical protein